MQPNLNLICKAFFFFVFLFFISPPPKTYNVAQIRGIFPCLPARAGKKLDLKALL